MGQSLTSIRLRRQWIDVDSIKLTEGGYVECWVGAAGIIFKFKSVISHFGSIEDFETVVRFDSPTMVGIATADEALHRQIIEFGRKRTAKVGRGKKTALGGPMPAAIIIPARLESTRLPRKMLLAETGKPLIQHTYEAAQRASLASMVLVATDSEEIADAVQGFGGTVALTGPHVCGSDRVAEAAARIDGWDIIVNLQGDEPEIKPADIDAAIQLLQETPEADVATLVTPLRHLSQDFDENCVKAMLHESGEVLRFSRSCGRMDHYRYQHVGLYAYRNRAMQAIAAGPQTEDEKRYRLEQLRAQAMGFRFFAAEVAESPKGIDTPQDYQAFVRRYLGDN